MDNKSGNAPFLFMIACFVLVAIGGVALFMFMQQRGEDWNDYQLQFPGISKHIYVQLDLNDKSKFEKTSRTKYTLSKGPNEIYTYEYFESLDAMKNALVTSHDSDGTLAGGGVYYNDSTVTIGDYEYSTLLNYYNPISSTKSGEYDKITSTILTTSYIYEIPETKEVLLFGFNLSYDGSIHEPEMIEVRLVEVIL